VKPPTKIVRLSWRNAAERAADLRTLVWAYSRHPAIRHEALVILKGAGVRRPDKVKSARAIFEWMRRTVPYHLEAAEQVATPGHMLRNRTLGGDCDDHAILLASLLESIKIPARIVYWTKPMGSQASHVSVAFWDGTAWRNADTTQPNPMGWVPPGFTYQLGTDAEKNPGQNLQDRIDTRTPNDTGDGVGIFGVFVELYEAGENLVEGAVDLISDAAHAVGEGMGLVLELGEAVLETFANFVAAFLDFIGDLGAAVADFFRRCVESLIEWASDPGTWIRLLVSLIICAGGAAAAGAATAGVGGAAVIGACAAEWATGEMGALAVDHATGEFERATGLDIPDVLEPANISRLASGVDWETVGELASTEADKLASAAVTYAEARLKKELEGIPSRLEAAVRTRALSILRDSAAYRALPGAARQYVEQTVSTETASLSTLSAEGWSTRLDAASEVVNAIPAWSEMAPELREAISQKMTDAASASPEWASAQQRMKEQMVNLSTAKMAVITQQRARGSQVVVWQRMSREVAGLDASIDQRILRPRLLALVREVDLESELWPPTQAELNIARLAGEWTGPTGAELLLSEATVEETRRAADVGRIRATFKNPVGAIKAILKHRAFGPTPDQAMLNALSAKAAKSKSSGMGWGTALAAAAAVGAGAAVYTKRKKRKS